MSAATTIEPAPETSLPIAAGPPLETPGIGVYLLLCAAAALWADLGTLHRLQHGDSLLPVLVSIQYWTPFFWEQDRYGMLIPFLAQPLTNPFANLLFQGFLNVFCGLSAFFLLPRYVLPGARYPLMGALGAAAFLLLAPAAYRFDYLMDANYGVWMVLGLGSLILIEPRADSTLNRWSRWLAALVLMVLAHWVYRATALYLGTLVIFQVLFAAGSLRKVSEWRPRSSSWTVKDLPQSLKRAAWSGPSQALLVLGVGSVAGGWLTGFARHHTTTIYGLPPGSWLHAWSRMVEETWKALAPGGWPLVLAGTAVLFLAVRLRCKNLDEARPPIPWRPAAALTATAVVVALFMGTRLWLKLNAYVPRYLLPSVFFIEAALVILIVGALDSRIAYAGCRREPARAALLLMMSVAWAYGTPSPRRVRADLDRFGTLTPDVIAAGCTHLAGNYWTVWPTIFHVSLTLHERGDPRIVWGVTLRGQPTSRLWWNTPQEQRCVCIPVGDPYGDNWLLAFGFSRFRDVERRNTVRVLRRQKPPVPAGPDTSKKLHLFFR